MVISPPTIDFYFTTTLENHYVLDVKSELNRVVYILCIIHHYYTVYNKQRDHKRRMETAKRNNCYKTVL